MSILQELMDRNDVHNVIHVHLDYAEVRGAVITQDVYVCIACNPTTYDLEVMRRFRDSFRGFEIAGDFAVCGSQLRFGELTRTEKARASITDLETLGVEVRGISNVDKQRELYLAQRFFVRVLPYPRLLDRHEPGNYRPPHWTGNNLFDRFVVKCLVH